MSGQVLTNLINHSLNQPLTLKTAKITEFFAGLFEKINDFCRR